MDTTNIKAPLKHEGEGLKASEMTLTSTLTPPAILEVTSLSPEQEDFSG